MTKELILLKAEVLKAIRTFMDQEGFVEELYPGITPATGSCEAIANIFVLKDANQFLTLRQTAQLFLEESIVKTQLPRMYTIGRSFRRDTKDDGRHLQDFTLLEWEALDTDLAWLCDFNSELIEYVIQHVLRVSSKYGLLTPNEHKNLYSYWRSGIKEITYSNAIDLLRRKEIPDISKFPVDYFSWGDDLTADAESVLTDKYGMLQVIEYPEDIKFFNMKNNPTQSWEKEIGDRSTVKCVDVLLPKAGETIGGSQREDDYEVLLSKLENSIMLRQLTALKEAHDGEGSAIRKAFNDYLNLFKGTRIIRSGAGLGLGRLLQFLKNSDEIIAF